VRLVGLALSAREAWQLTLDNGLVIVLGREQERASVNQRLARFVVNWPRVKEQIDIQVAVADLRYPGGFALAPVVAPTEPATDKGRK
jgi:cell division protein FtsQ